LTAFNASQVEAIVKKYNEVAVREGIYDSIDYVNGVEIVKNKLLNFEENGKILALEIKFGFKDTPTIITSEGVELIGAIDKLVQVNEDTLLVVDYKTSKTVPDTDKLRTDIQLSMYHYAVNKLFPEYKRVILALDMLRVGELVYTYRTEEELKLLDGFLNEVYRQMLSFDENKATGQLNPLCSWCDFRGICPECKEAVSSIDKDFLPPEEMTSEDLHLEWDTVKSKLKLLETRKNELSTFLMTSLDEVVEDIANNTHKFITVQRKRKSFNPKVLSDLIPKDAFLDMISMSAKKVVDFANKNPKLKDKILATSETCFTSPYIDTKKLDIKKPSKSSAKKDKFKEKIEV